jgi:hypothetical protein
MCGGEGGREGEIYICTLTATEELGGGGGVRGEDGQLWCYECWCEDKESSLIYPPADIFSKVRHFGKLHAFTY